MGRVGLRRPHRVIQQGLVAEYRFDKRNRLLWSEDFTNAAWDTNNLTKTADQAIAPDGRNTADKIAETAINNIHRMNQFPASGADQTHSLSVYAKYGTRQWLYLYIADYSGSHIVRAWFDIQNGVVGTVGHIGNGSGEKGYIRDVGNGWYRCTLVGKPNTSAGNMLISYYLASGNGISSYLGDITKYIYLWGAQLELGSAATTYQQTTDGQTLTDDKGGYNGQLGSTSGADTNDPTWDGQELDFTTDDYVGMPDDAFNAYSSGTIVVVAKLNTRPALAASGTIFSVGSATVVNAILSAQFYGLAADDTRLRVSSINTDLVYGSTNIATGSHVVITIKSSGSAWTIKIGNSTESLTVEGGSNTGDWFADVVNGVMQYAFGVLRRSTGNENYLEASLCYSLLYTGETNAAEDARNNHYLRQILATRGISLAA